MLDSYELVTFGTTCPGGSVTSLSKCIEAAAALGLTFWQVQPTPNTDPDDFPPYCYVHVDRDEVVFNTDGTNTGECNRFGSSACVCYAGTYFT